MVWNKGPEVNNNRVPGKFPGYAEGLVGFNDWWIYLKNGTFLYGFASLYIIQRCFPFLSYRYIYIYYSLRVTVEMKTYTHRHECNVNIMKARDGHIHICIHITTYHSKAHVHKNVQILLSTPSCRGISYYNVFWAHITPEPESWSASYVEFEVLAPYTTR